MGKIKIGIDQSINSTAVCVIEEGEKPIYYIIVPKMTKKMMNIKHSRICYITYDKIDLNLNHNIKCISERIARIIEKIKKKTEIIINKKKINNE